jgi:hypothetical protein
VRTRLALDDTPVEPLAALRTEPVFRPTPSQIWVTLLSALQLLFVVAMAFFALYQVLAQLAFFRFLDRLPGAQRSGITLWLKHDDTFREFGLHVFTRALGSLYSAIAICLLIPVIFRAEQGAQSSLELVGKLLLACIPLAPLILTLVARRPWTSQCRERASRDQPDGPLRVEQQRLWPISLRKPRLAGVIMTIALTGYLVGLELVDYLP